MKSYLKQRDFFSEVSYKLIPEIKVFLKDSVKHHRNNFKRKKKDD